MRLTILAATLASVGLFGGTASLARDQDGLDQAAREALEQAVAGTQRSEANRARDA